MNCIATNLIQTLAQTRSIAKAVERSIPIILKIRDMDRSAVPGLRQGLGRWGTTQNRFEAKFREIDGNTATGFGTEISEIGRNTVGGFPQRLRGWGR